jgi:hypothetical protein
MTTLTRDFMLQTNIQLATISAINVLLIGLIPLFYRVIDFRLTLSLIYYYNAAISCIILLLKLNASEPSYLLPPWFNYWWIYCELLTLISLLSLPVNMLLNYRTFKESVYNKYIVIFSIGITILNILVLTLLDIFLCDSEYC